jgi:hypothetical protein
MRFIRSLPIWITWASFSLSTWGVVTATPISWNLNGTESVGGAPVTGSFIYDADTNIFSNWSISIPDVPSLSIVAETLTPADSFFVFGNPGPLFDIIFLSDNPQNQMISLALVGLSDAEGTVNLLEPSTIESITRQQDLVVGSATAQVPEPKSYALVLIGGIGAFVWRRNRTYFVSSR